MNVRGLLTLVEKRETFYDLSVTKESEKLIIKLLFTSRRPPARSHADMANTRSACACNTKASPKNARRGPPAVWSERAKSCMEAVKAQSPVHFHSRL